MTIDYGLAIFPQHQQLLRESAISVEVTRARGYVSVDTKKRLEDAGFSPHQRRVPGLLIPVHDEHGTVALYQYRPDDPRAPKAGKNAGKAIKYETPKGARMVVDVPPGVREHLGDPKTPLWVTEGSRKADAAVTAGLACVALLGVWNWRGANSDGGKVALAFWDSVALNGRRVYIAFDSDAMTKKGVHDALARFGPYLTRRGADVAYVYLPAGNGAKVGLDDYLAAGGTVDELVHTARSEPLAPVQEELPEPKDPDPVPVPRPVARPTRVDLAAAHAVFRRWLGEEYDLDVLNAVLACAATEQLGGDPPWLLVVSGSGAAKTETVVPLGGAGAHVISTVASEGALLSATPRTDRGKDATGGLLRQIGPRGLVVIKDFTSIISMSRDSRAQVLAALREVYDGRWQRNVGVDGGRTLTWEGRLVVIGAVTTAYDSAHEVVSKMGDRFALARLDSGAGAARLAAGRRALSNVDQEVAMRAELAAVVGGLLAHIDVERAILEEDDQETLLTVADLVTLARTAVERDYRGDVIDAHAPEMPTRFAKMLGQLVRGGLAIGMSREHAVAVAVRVAGDSMPPLRLAILGDVADHPLTRTAGVYKRLQRPRNTVDRELQALHMLGLLVQEEHPGEPGWLYQLSEHTDPQTLKILVSRNGSSYTNAQQEVEKKSEISATETSAPHSGTAISGHQDHTPVLWDDTPSAPVCPDCNWPIDTNAHANQCEGARS